MLLVDHLAHVADTLAALRRAAVTGEHLAGTAGALLDGGAHVALADPVAVADVHGGERFRSIENASLAGSALRPWPGRSSVTTRYFAANAGTWAAHDDESHVHPWTKTIVALPVPVVDE